MKFIVKEMKDTTTVIKRVVTDKDNGQVHLKANGDGFIHVYGTNKFVGCYSRIKALNKDVFNFTVNPYELHKLFTDNDKKKAKKLLEMEFKVHKKSMREATSDQQFKIEPTEWDETIYAALHTEVSEILPKSAHPDEEYDFFPPSPWRYVQDEKRFLQVLQEAHEAIKNNMDIRTSYLALRSGKGLVTENRRANLYRLGENFPFEVIYIHKDAVSVLAASIKAGEIAHKKTNEGFFLSYKRFLYWVRDDQQTVFPSLRKMTVKRNRFSFEIDADLFNKEMKNYKAVVKEFICQFDSNSLKIIPTHSDYEPTTLPITNISGTPQECKFASDVLKGFFGSFTNTVKVEDVEYVNLQSKEGYLWRVYKPEQLNVGAGIWRPDWALLDTLHRMGKLKHVSTQQEVKEMVEQLQASGELPSDLSSL
ncbi:hypothetical protein CN918_26370 [Priestia megaterium]|nr:hypothetical protein CN918_26370 [Priestia megaterium]